MDNIIRFIKNYRYPYQIELSSTSDSYIQPIITITRENKSYGIFRQLSPTISFQLIFFTNFSYRYGGPRHPKSYVDFLTTLAFDIGQYCNKTVKPLTTIPTHLPILCIIEVNLSAVTHPFVVEIHVAPENEYVKLRSILSNNTIKIENMAISNLSSDKIINDMFEFVGNRDIMKYVQKGKPWDKRYIQSLLTSAKKDREAGNTDYQHFIVIDNNRVVAYFSTRPYGTEKQIRLITYPGKGYGSIIVEYLRYTTHYAFVHPDNIGSNKLFHNNNYEFKGIIDNLNLYYSQSPNVL